MNYRRRSTTVREHLCFVELEWPEFDKTESQLVHLQSTSGRTPHYFLLILHTLQPLCLVPNKVRNIVDVTHSTKWVWHNPHILLGVSLCTAFSWSRLAGIWNASLVTFMNHLQYLRCSLDKKDQHILENHSSIEPLKHAAKVSPRK